MHGISRLIGVWFVAAALPACGGVRVWLGMARPEPSHVVVNWETAAVLPGVVRHGATAACEGEAESAAATRHEVEVPFPEGGGDLFYRIQAGTETTPVYRVRNPNAAPLRVAVVGNWHGREKLGEIVLRDEPHLLVTAGDNIPRLWEGDRRGDKEDVAAYQRLVDGNAELFRTVPVLPILGNHDREILPRGERYPPAPTYDVEATAFRRFFSLPGREWVWHLDVPGAGLRLVALDLNHTSDFGTTWQTCHPFGSDSEQYEWYRTQVAGPAPRYVVALQNEQNAAMRGKEGGAWTRLHRRASAVVTGFGHFAERAEVDGVAYLNTSLNGRGAQYKDPHGVFLAGEDNYVLLTVPAAPAEARLEIKALDGRVLDTRLLTPRGQP